MSDLVGQGILLVIAGLLGSGGLIGAWLQSRASRAVGVKNANVEADKSAGQLALDVAVHVTQRMAAQETRIDALATENERRRGEVAALRSQLRSVLEEVESVAVDLRRVVVWDEAGRVGDPPVDLAELHERLRALSTRKVGP